METVSREEIKRKLAKHYPGPTSEHMELRELIEYNHEEKGYLDKGGCIFLFLSGTPPKGYAICVPDLRRISLYDPHGKRFKIMRETVLEAETGSGGEK